MGKMIVLFYSGGYSAVHIRRGDKVATGGTPDFPLLFYVRALKRICHANKGQCSRKVFVTCDDAKVCREFEDMAQKCFQVKCTRKKNFASKTLIIEINLTNN